MKQWNGDVWKIWKRPEEEKEVSVTPVKTERMKNRIIIWGVILAAALTACSGSKKAGKFSAVQTAADTTSVEEKQKQFEYLFIEALKQKMVGNPQKAVSLLAACLEIDPNSSAAMYELANLHILNNDLTSASLLLEKAIGINQNNKWFKILLAKIYQQTGKDAQAAGLYDQLSKMEPDNQEYLYMEALELAKAKKYDEAIKAFNVLEKKTGCNEQISNAKQQVYLDAGKVKEAFAEIHRLISSDPSDPRYVGLLADLYSEQGDMVNALKYYRKIQEMDPDNGFVNFSLASYYLAQGDTVQAYQYTLKGFQNEKVEVETKLQLYLLYTGKDSKNTLKPEQIEELVLTLVRQYPDDPRVYSVYADYLINHDRKKEAREQLLKVIGSGENDYSIWEQVLYLDNDLSDWQSLYDHGKSALELFPNQGLFYFLQAVGALQLDKYNEAVAISDEGLNYVIDNKQLKGQFVFLKGEAKYKLKKLEEAFKLFDEAIELDPENFIALNNYAYYLSLVEKDLEKAERMSGKVIERYPDNATYLDTYAWVLFKKKNYTLAKFYMETALNHAEDDKATLIDHYGDILFMLGNTDDALNNWNKALSMGSTSKVLKQKIAQKKYIREE
jgi:tetratricopeptide (TPR) repeat protein